MTCDDARSLFSARADEALTPEEGARLAAHLETCPECRAEWTRFERTVSLVRAVEPARAPAGFVDRVLELSRPVPWHRRLAGQLFLPLRIKLPIEAAAIVLVAGLVVLIFERSPEMRQAARPAQVPSSVARDTPAAPAPPGPPPASAPVDAPRAPAAEAPAKTPDRSSDDAPRKLSEVKESDAQARAPEVRAKVDDERRADRAERESPATPPAAPAPPPAAREPLFSTRPDAGARSAPPQRAETAQRAAGLAAPAVRARLAAPDPATALGAVAEAVSRAGGTEVARRAEADGTVVDAIIPGGGYAAFLRDLQRLGGLTTEQQPDEPSASVRVTIRITR
jgi:hypothetical protein